MLEFLSQEMVDGLETARKNADRRKSRLRVQVGEAVFPVLRFWHDGFVLDGTLSPHLRGLVDIYEGDRHVFQCLIVASSSEGREITCDFKRLTPVTDKAPLDFWLDPTLPVGFITKD
ncbi:hypothetical protein GC209_05270 [bacterium]|nr:hypothetical protein [bacterium]